MARLVPKRAKDSGELETLRQIAGDPHGFILRQDRASLDFRDEEQIARLQSFWKVWSGKILTTMENGRP